MPLKIDEKSQGDWTVVAPVGRIDTLTAKDLETRLGELLSSGQNQLVLDLENIEFISSFGLRVILITAKKLMAEGKSLPLCNLSDDVKNVFDVSGFSKILPIHASLADATAATS